MLLFTEETRLRGFTIPDGTPVFANLHSAIFDSKYCPNPTAFDPHNFFDVIGRKFIKREAQIPFSIGK